MSYKTVSQSARLQKREKVFEKQINDLLVHYLTIAAIKQSEIYKLVFKDLTDYEEKCKVLVENVELKKYYQTVYFDIVHQIDDLREYEFKSELNNKISLVVEYEEMFMEEYDELCARFIQILCSLDDVYNTIKKMLTES